MLYAPSPPLRHDAHWDATAGVGVAGLYDIHSDATPSLSSNSGPASVPTGSVSASVLTPGRRDPPPPPLGRPSKRQEAAMESRYRLVPTDAYSDHRTDMFSDSGITGTETEVGGLRAEMEDLRQQMEHIRAERWAPPPQYEVS